jgi:hypothetical protein
MSTKPQSTEYQIEAMKHQAVKMFHNDHNDGDTAIYALVQGFQALLTTSNREAIWGLQEILDKPIDSTTRIDLEYLLATLKGEKV